VSYDVYAFTRSVADSYLDDEKGFNRASQRVH